MIVKLFLVLPNFYLKSSCHMRVYLRLLLKYTTGPGTCKHFVINKLLISVLYSFQFVANCKSLIGKNNGNLTINSFGSNRKKFRIALRCEFLTIVLIPSIRKRFIVVLEGGFLTIVLFLLNS